MHFLSKVGKISHFFKLNQAIDIEHSPAISFYNFKIFLYQPEKLIST